MNSVEVASDESIDVFDGEYNKRNCDDLKRVDSVTRSPVLNNIGTNARATRAVALG